jgi:hypothetical protein
MKTPDEFARLMSERNPDLAKRPEGPFVVSAQRHSKPRNFYWPETGDLEQAVRAAEMGFGAAALIAVCNAIIATICVVGHTTILGIGPDAYSEALVFAIIASGIRCRSKVAAAAGLGLFVVEKGAMFVNQPKSLMGLTMTIFLVVCLISGVRGVWAYHRFAPADGAQEAAPIKLLGMNLRKPGSLWVTAVLSIIILCKALIGWVHTFEALHNALPGGPPIAGENPLAYTIRAAAVVLLVLTLYAIVRRPAWGRAVCAVFALVVSAVVAVLTMHFLMGNLASKVAVWTLMCTPLVLYLDAICIGKPVKAYFAKPAAEATGFGQHG